MTIEIIDHKIKIFAEDCWRRWHRGMSWNHLLIPELAYGPFRKMWIHKVRQTSQTYIVEGYVVQRTHLMVVIVRTVSYVICNSLINKHHVRIYPLIHSICGKGASARLILVVLHLRLPPKYSRKVRSYQIKY